MSSSIFDASALLAVLNSERGHKNAEGRVFGATISAINYSEVLKKTVEVGGSSDKIELLLAKQRLLVIPFDRHQAVKAAAIWPLAKPHGLSFADRACVSLGLMLELPVLTADADMTKIDLPVKFELIRKRH